MLQLDERVVDGVLTLEVGGDVDSATADELRKALRRVPPGTPLVVDLRSVPFMDSAGLGALICGFRELRFNGGVVSLCVRPGGVHRLLSVTGFDRIVPTLPSLDEACKAVRDSGELVGSPVS